MNTANQPVNIGNRFYTLADFKMTPQAASELGKLFLALTEERVFTGFSVSMSFSDMLPEIIYITDKSFSARPLAILRGQARSVDDVVALLQDFCGKIEENLKKEMDILNRKHKAILDTALELVVRPLKKKLLEKIGEQPVFSQNLPDGCLPEYVAFSGEESDIIYLMHRTTGEVRKFVGFSPRRFSRQLYVADTSPGKEDTLKLGRVL